MGCDGAKKAIIQSSKWYESFLSRNLHWVTNYNHNHLRITRAIKSLRLLVNDDEARRFRSAMLQKYREKMVGVTGIEPVTPTMST